MRKQLLGVMVLAAGCGGGGESGSEDESSKVETIGSVTQSVAMERAGLVEYAFRHYDNANIARVAFASGQWGGGCSATLIGPAIVLTAAHCGPGENDATQTRTFRIVTYRTNETEQNSESFTCKRLIHGWPRNDLALLYCEPNSFGVYPGDRYGYLETETRAPTNGDAVYSIWWNPVVGGATGNAWVPLYSPGKVTSTTACIWPDYLGGPSTDPVGISTNTWTQPGASGSSQIDAATHRILIGPTSTGSDDAPGRHALSQKTYFEVATLIPDRVGGEPVDVGPLQNVTRGNFPAGTYDFDHFLGSVDKNQNHVFDVQEEIEYQHGEHQRSSYWLGFDSRRRNALWETGFVLINFDSKSVPVAYAAPGLIVRNRKLHLKPNTNYRVSARIRTNSASSANSISVGFERTGQPAWSVGTLATNPGTTSTRVALIHTDANPDPFFAIRTTAAFDGEISEVQLLEDTKTMTFDLADERIGWTSHLFGGTAHFLPRGRATTLNGTPDFALEVKAGPLKLTNTVSTRSPLFVANRSQRLCFDVRSVDSGVQPGTVRVQNGSTQALNASVPVTSTWTTQCFGRIFTPNTAETTLSFVSSNGASYLIDNVRVSEDGVFIPIPGDLPLK